ncbi:hypothetical protein H5R92_02815 [Limosilactobacillus sp. BG-MG3-A]|uniref:Uncharacterized protein n=1 Tax=Limosilactobacillus agrestis TaxID=2759748 RepID=A0A7W3UGK7_9LACO|nr:hypothetical protein [Limosilactobacillus agrestis]MBB1095153.1 hypothetical protein [Limosilactobacillus agrestis]
MTTRSELRRTQRQEKVEQSIEATSQKHHFLYCLWGVICVTLLGLALLVNSTLLNVNFIKKEVTSSSLESVILSQVNSSLTQYGISTSVLQKSDTDKLINQAIDQIYAGEKIKLDLSPVVNSVNSSVNSQLAQYGLSTSMLPAGSSSAITSNINSMVNSQLNTPEVAQLINGIKIAKTITNFILAISIIGLIVLILKGLWRRHLISSFRWICLWGTILYTGTVMAIHALALQIGEGQPDLGPFISQVANDFQQTGFHISMIIIVVSIVLFILQFVKRKWRPRQ